MNYRVFEAFRIGYLFREADGGDPLGKETDSYHVKCCQLLSVPNANMSLSREI